MGIFEGTSFVVRSSRYSMVGAPSFDSSDSRTRSENPKISTKAINLSLYSSNLRFTSVIFQALFQFFVPLLLAGQLSQISRKQPDGEAFWFFNRIRLRTIVRHHANDDLARDTHAHMFQIPIIPHDIL